MRKQRARHRRSGRGSRVFRSDKHIYAQVISDETRHDAARGVDAAAGAARRSCRRPATSPRPSRSASSSPGAVRRRASPRSSSIATAFSITAACTRWPRAPARAASSSEEYADMAQMGSSSQRRIVDDRGIELKEKVVHINRVAKVVKGGRRFSFSALVVVGDSAGRVGFGLGKANEVPEAIRKGIERAKKSTGRRAARRRARSPSRSSATSARARCCCSPRRDGTGVIAGGGVRAVVELAGRRATCSRSASARTTRTTWCKATIAALARAAAARAGRGAARQDARGAPLRATMTRRKHDQGHAACGSAIGTHARASAQTLRGLGLTPHRQVGDRARTRRRCAA